METRTLEELSLCDGAEEWLNKLINRDGTYKDLASRLVNGNHVSGKVSVSGMREVDYPIMRFRGGGELEITKSFSLPPDLIDKFSGMQKNCLMGIFSSCERAWITIDNEIFMWNYEDGEDLAYYDGVKDTIICVGLASPRFGLLPAHVRHLLCIATPLEIVVLGMTYRGSVGLTATGSTSGPVLQVMPDPLYCLPTDNLTLVCMEATESGRIFFGTQEGSLLELDCRPIPGWHHDSTQPLPDARTGPCTLINHSTSTLGLLLPSILTSGFRTSDALCQIACDSSRCLLYTRTENSNVTVYEYTNKSASSVSRGGSLTRVSQLSGSDLAHTASSLVRSVDKAQFRSLVSLHPLSAGSCHLMAVTQTGVRFYFGAYLQLQHVRMPPNSPYSRIGLSEVKLVTETRGTVVFASALPPNSNPLSLHAISSPFGSPSPFTGTSTMMTRPPTTQPDDPLTLSINGATSTDYDCPPHVLYTLSPDPYPWTPTLTEVCSAAWCVGGAWALVVLPQRKVSCSDIDFTDRDAINGHISSTSGLASCGEPPVVLTQHLDPPYRRLLLISSQGLIHLRVPSPLYRLREFLLCESSSNMLDTNVGPLTTVSHVTRANVSYPNLTGLGEPEGEVVVDTRFLTAYLHQYGPDESICAALAIGAALVASVDGNSRIMNLRIEQAILHFAAEAAQFCIPAVKRPTTQFMKSIPQTHIMASIGPAATTSMHTQLMDKTLSSGLFLFSGICLFLARVGRTFWRSPLFCDAINVSHRDERTATTSTGLRSWMHSFVSALASASPLRSGQTTEPEVIHPIISRLDPIEITWLVHQITFLLQFLRRHLTVRGGWFRVDMSLESVRTRGVNQPAAGDYADITLLQRLAEDLDSLLNTILEVLGFWRILSEHVVHKVVEHLTSEQRQLLLHTSFESYTRSLMDSITHVASTPLSRSGIPAPAPTDPAHSLNSNVVMDLITSLINALIEYYLDETNHEDGDVVGSVSLDRITNCLKSACPSLFSNEDVLSAKACECLMQGNALRVALVSTSNHNAIKGCESAITQSSTDNMQMEVDQLISHALNLYLESGPAIHLDQAVQRLMSTGAWRAAITLCLTVACKRDPNDIAVDCLKNGRRPSAEPIVPNIRPDRRNRQHWFAYSELSATEGRYEAYHQMIRCIERVWESARLPASSTDLPKQTVAPVGSSENAELGASSLPIPHMTDPSLTPTSARTLLSVLLEDVVQSTDILAHFEIIGWLLSHGLTDTAIRLNSPHLEAYLRSRLRQTPDDPDLRCLLWRQLEQRGARLEAAQILEHLAVMPCKQLTLEARLDFAARAIVMIKALPAAQQELDYLHELEVRFQLAQLQHQMYVELSKTIPNVSASPLRPLSPHALSQNEVDEALFQLAHGPLLSLSEMFTDYADRFDLHESKLALLWAGDSKDSALIKAVWRDLLHHILSSCSVDSRISPRHSPPLRNFEARRTSDSSSSIRLIELALVGTLARLGERFSIDGALSSTKSQMFFPLPEIICTLEYYAIHKRLSYAWLPTVFCDARLTCSSNILEAYDALLHSKDTFWRRPEVRTRLLLAVVTVVEDFLNTVSIQLPMRQRMLQTGRILDRVTGFLVDLNSDATKNTEADKGTRGVIERLRHVHAQLQRYYR